MRPAPPGGFGARVPQLAPLVVAVLIVAGAIVAFAASLGGGTSSSGADVRVHGRVLDTAGHPVAGAVVSDTVTGDSTRTSRSGAFSVVLSPGRRLLAAARPGYVSDARTVRLSGSTSADFSLWSLRPSRPVVNSADRLLFWFDCPQLATLSDAALTRFKREGVDGFVCESGRLAGMGGTAAFTPSMRSLAGPRYSLERRIRESGVVGRAKRLGMRSYIAFYASNSSNNTTPFADWFDDSRWNRTVLPGVRNLAGAARALGFDGVAIDQELYSSKTATWSWAYPGNRRPEAAVRAKARQRGGQLMRAMVTSFPGLELIAYDTQLPTGWEARVQQVNNGARNAFADSTQIDMWSGIASVPGYSAIRWLDAVFYKMPQVAGATWDQALQYEARAVYSLLSRRFSNWGYAASRLDVTPFSWIDTGPCGCDFEAARPPDYVAAQLAAFRRWGTGRTFANYAYRGPGGFDYAPYAPAMRAASRPGIVDSQAPRLSLAGTAAPRHGRASLTGTATDDFAVRLIAWRDASGDQGAAKLTPDLASPDGAAVSWAIDGIPAAGRSTTVWLRVEDIHGLSAVTRVRIRG